MQGGREDLPREPVDRERRPALNREEAFDAAVPEPEEYRERRAGDTHENSDLEKYAEEAETEAELDGEDRRRELIDEQGRLTIPVLGRFLIEAELA